MSIAYPIPPSAEVSKIEKLNGLWSLAGIKNIESKQISVSRAFASFEALWNITLKSPALQPVLNKITTRDLGELKQNVRASLVVNENQSVTYAAHANAIKGTV
jgi:hypothetical protein